MSVEDKPAIIKIARAIVLGGGLLFVVCRPGAVATPRMTSEPRPTETPVPEPSGIVLAADCDAIKGKTKSGATVRIYARGGITRGIYSGAVQSGNDGSFEIGIIETLRNGSEAQINVYAFNEGKSQYEELAGSPVNLNCPPASK